MEKKSKDDQNAGFFSLGNTTKVYKIKLIMKKMN